MPFIEERSRPVAESRFLSIKEKVHPTYRTSTFDTHATYEIILVLAGRGHYETMRKGLVETTPVREGVLLFRDAKEPHRSVDDPEDPLHQIVCVFDYGFLAELSLEEEMRKQLVKDNPMVFSDRILVSEIKGLLRRILTETGRNDLASSDAISASFASIFVVLFRFLSNRAALGKKPDERIQGVLRRLQDISCELSVAQCADQLGLSKRHFSNLFKKETGRNFVRYLQEQRVSVAKDLLTKSDKRITTISFESGFENQSHFIKIFKRVTGLTPFLFRQKNRLA